MALISNKYVRGLLVFIIVVMSSQNILAALIVALIFLAVQFALSQQQLIKTVHEGFQNYGTPLAQCGGYEAGQAKRVGTIFYPLNDNPTVQKLRNQGLANVVEEPSGDFAFSQYAQ
jgi:hypothetical protein